MAEKLDFAKFYRLVGASEVCEVCGHQRWGQLIPEPPADYQWPDERKKPEYLYIGSQADEGASRDILVYPIAAAVCTNCGNVRQHLLPIMKAKLSEDDDGNG